MTIMIDGVEYPKYYYDRNMEGSLRQNIWILYGRAEYNRVSMNIIGSEYIFRSFRHEHIGAPVYFDIKFLKSAFTPIIYE